MMLSKDGTSIIGKIGFLLPLLILFIAADAAACPEHRSGAALRTKAVKIKNGGQMRTTVIGYRAPATYRLCGNTLRDTRGVAYVRDGYRNGISSRYVPVRNVDRSPRYVAVRNIERAPRYVAVRQSRPVYIEDSDFQYVAVRNADRYPVRTRRIVRGIDIGPDPGYVAVRRTPMYVDNASRKYVAVRHVVRDIDMVDESRYVPVRNVDRYDSGTRYVAVRDRSDDFPAEIEEIALHDEEPLERRHIVEYSDAAFSDVDDDATFISTSSAEDACLYPATVRTSPIVETRMVSYVADDDIDDYAFLRVRSAAPSVASYKPVSYEYADDDVIEVENNDIDYIASDDAIRTVSYVPVDNDVGMIHHRNVMYVSDDGLESPCLQRVAVRTCSDFDTDEISYVAIDRPSMQTVNYVPVDEVENVSYIPVEEPETVSYVPISNAVYSDVSEVEDVDCPLNVSGVRASPLYVSEASTQLIEIRDTEFGSGLGTAGRIAANIGYRDGFKDGADAATDLDTYDPEDEGDYENATNGYEDDYGDKDHYKESYRSAYLTGYRAGFESIGVRDNIG